MAGFDTFSECVLKRAKKIIDRAACFVWFRLKVSKQPSSITEMANDFAAAGLARPNVTKLREAIRKDRRFVKSKSSNAWRLSADMLESVEGEFDLRYCLGVKSLPKSSGTSYVDTDRLGQIKALKSSDFDFARLVEMLAELNVTFERGNYIAVIALLRAVIDHVPPIFSCKSFGEVANNYSGPRSFKKAAKDLENTSRNIADSYLHIQIRRTESLPTKTQVDFSNSLDTILSEVVRLIEDNQMLP